MREPATQPAARRGRPGYDQQAVLRTAIDVFIRQGYDGTSMGDLARELGLSKSAIYHHVPSKQHLLALALDEALDALTEGIESAATAPDLDAEGRLRLAVRHSVEVLVRHLPAVTLLLRVRGNSDIELHALRRRRAVDERLAGLVTDAVQEGSLREDLPPDLVTRLLFGTVNSAVEWYRPDGAVDAAALSAAITSMAFDGLARRD